MSEQEASSSAAATETPVASTEETKPEVKEEVKEEPTASSSAPAPTPAPAPASTPAAIQQQPQTESSFAHAALKKVRVSFCVETKG